MDRAKGPAAAAGMALLGAAGMAAASRKDRRRRRLPKPSVTVPRPDLTKAKKALKKVDLPTADDAIDWVERRARVVGDTGHRVADATSQARTVKKAVTGK